MRRLLLVAALGVWPGLTPFAAQDDRQAIPMSPEARVEMRAEMLDFQIALHQIVEALAEGRHAQAADVAERNLGVSAMGRHRTAPPNARPGMFMPADMHAIARTMHVSGSEFAKAAKSGDTTKALGALGAVTGACVACHRSYRIQ